VNDEERIPRSRQDPRRDGEGLRPAETPPSRPPLSGSASGRDTAPPSTRAGAPLSTRAGAPASSRAPAGSRDEVTSLYRRLAELQSALAEAEACVVRGRGREAAADEMNGQMLAHLSDVEARLRGAEDAARGAQVRAQRAEARTAELEALLSREQEARETLRLRVVDLAEVCEERDGALLREEVLEVELEEARADARQQREAHEAELTSLRERGAVSEAHPKASHDGAASSPKPRPPAEAPVSAVTGGEPDTAGLRADRDALAAEVRQLRAVIDAVTRALGELKQAPRETPSGEPASPRPAGEPGPGSEDEATRVFGAEERELVRSLGRR
jgi:hypothetical protein